jgi:hypothetical protein
VCFVGLAYQGKDMVIRFNVEYRVDQLVIKHLSTQGRLDPRGGALLFLISKQILTPPPLGTSDTLIIVKNGLEMRKLWPPKVKG